MNIEQILTILGSGTVTGIVGYFAGKRRTNAETDNVVLLNLEKSVQIYKDIIDDLKTQIGKLNSKIEELENKIDELYAENRQLKQKTKSL